MAKMLAKVLREVALVVLIASASGYQLPCRSAVAPAVAARSAVAPAVARSATPVAMFKNPFEKEPEPEGEPEKEKPKITLDGLLQVMSMGAGAPMLGDLKKTNFKKPEAEAGAALQFELEANNFDLNSRGKYFDSGNSDESAYDGPGFFENLMSGGKLQRKYDEKMRNK